MAGHRLFFPFRDMPTLIWIKKKEGIFCARGEPRHVLQSGQQGSGCQKFNDDEAILPPAAKPSNAGARIVGFIDEAVHRDPDAAVPLPDRSIRP
jgi:hypothetical protein